MRYTILLVVLLAAHAPEIVSGQPACFTFDLNTPAYTETSSEYDSEFVVEEGISWRAGLLSKNFAKCDHAHRRSIFITHQTLNVTRFTPYTKTAHYSATSIEAGVDWLVLDRTWMRLSLGIAGGFTYVTYKGKDQDGCESPICGTLPSGLLSGICMCEIPISPRLSGVLGLRGWILGGGREDTFPFARGPVVSAGVQVN